MAIASAEAEVARNHEVFIAVPLIKADGSKTLESPPLGPVVSRLP
jgi:hypothetical protein